MRLVLIKGGFYYFGATPLGDIDTIIDSFLGLVFKRLRYILIIDKYAAEPNQGRFLQCFASNLMSHHGLRL